MSQKIVLDHGAGGGMSRELNLRHDRPCPRRHLSGEMEDSTLVDVPAGRLAITTDSFVIDPIFFGNGDIGKIAVAGTVNDLAVSGARPLYLTLAIILEEGFRSTTSNGSCSPIADTARAAKVRIVAGDHQGGPARRGRSDLSEHHGVGVLERRPLSSRAPRQGDQVIVSGYLGDHSIHILSMREGLGFENRVESDCAVLSEPIAALLDACGDGTAASGTSLAAGSARWSTNSPRRPAGVSSWSSRAAHPARDRHGRGHARRRRHVPGQRGKPLHRRLGGRHTDRAGGPAHLSGDRARGRRRDGPRGHRRRVDRPRGRP